MMLFIRAVRRLRFYFCLSDEEGLDLIIIDCVPILSGPDRTIPMIYKEDRPTHWAPVTSFGHWGILGESLSSNIRDENGALRSCNYACMVPGFGFAGRP